MKCGEFCDKLLMEREVSKSTIHIPEVKLSPDFKAGLIGGFIMLAITSPLLYLAVTNIYGYLTKP